MIDGRMDRHDEPDRAALRHRSRPDQDQGRAAGRRLLQDHRHQDLHLGRRARPRREHRPSRAGAHRRRAGRASRASRSSSCRKFWWTRTARVGARNGVSCGSIEHKMGIHGNSTCVMNYDGATGWLVGEENKGLNAMFMMMNEARLGVAHPGARAVRGRLPERRRLRQGPPPGPLADRAEEPRQAGRPDHRPSGRAPHADVDQGLQRGGARARALDRAASPTSRIARPTTRPSARRPTTCSA